MRFLLFERHESPTVAAGWVARVGSVNERPGITGISHFFEHMMFKGTETIGTKDIAADLRIIDEQEAVQEKMRAELAADAGAAAAARSTTSLPGQPDPALQGAARSSFDEPWWRSSGRPCEGRAGPPLHPERRPRA